jgi:imidazolonepropionase-like amidohydrolase
MRVGVLPRALLAVLLVLPPMMAPPLHAQSRTIRAGRVFDGVATMRANVDVVIDGDRITAVRPATGPLPAGALDLRAFTLLPGFIDTHVHLAWYVNAKNRLHTDDDGDAPDVQALAGAANAWATLQAGFTTVQSIGEPENKALRDAIARHAPWADRAHLAGFTE